MGLKVWIWWVCCIEVVGLPPHRASVIPSCDQTELDPHGCPSCDIHLLPVQHKAIMVVSPKGHCVFLSIILK